MDARRLTHIQYLSFTVLRRLARMLDIRVHKRLKQSELVILIVQQCTELGVTVDNNCISPATRCSGNGSSNPVSRMSRGIANHDSNAILGSADSIGSVDGVVYPTHMEGCLHGLFVKTTPHAGLGLFTRAFIPNHTVLGFYTGSRCHRSAYDSMPNLRQLEKYTMEMQSLKKTYRHIDSAAKRPVFINPSLDANGQVDARMHPMACANEPVCGTVANCGPVLLVIKRATLRLLGYTKLLKHMGTRKVIRCVAIIASRDIQENEEITWHYGEEYGKIRENEGYSVGEARHPTLVNERLILTIWNRPIPLNATDIGVGS